MTARRSATHPPRAGAIFEIDSIRQALIDGEATGEPERFDFAAFKRRKAAQLG